MDGPTRLLKFAEAQNLLEKFLAKGWRLIEFGVHDEEHEEFAVYFRFAHDGKDPKDGVL